MTNIELISSSTDIAELISGDVKLKPSSRGYVGLCPFHNEDTPSFHVYTDTQSYYCFGCHKGGNIFTYVMTRENVSFPEALQILADRAGINLQNERGERKHNRDILKLAEEFFIAKLKSPSGNAPRDYIMKRGLSESDMNTFGLGYAPESWDALSVYLRQNGFADRMIISSGLAIQSERGGIYDRFRGRIIFPIHSITGRTIAFGGRIITGEGAKYINSPESDTYRKRDNLYLMDIARNAIREKRRSILCEGYMDAIRLHKSGFHESVASLGTSLTSQQAEMLSRYADTCYICYDSDTAGQTAAIRGMYILQSNGLNVRVIMLPEGKDPDEFLLSHSREDFEDLITNAKPLIPAHIESMRSRLEDITTRKSAVKELISSLEVLSTGEIFEYKGQLCEALHVLPGELERMIITKNTDIPAHRPAHGKENSAPDTENIYSLECALCAMLMKNADYRLRISPEEAMNILTYEDTRTIAREILTEDVSTLNELWLQTEDFSKFGITELGEVAYRKMKELTDEERFTRAYSTLKRASIDRKIEELNALPMRERNIKELMNLYKEREKYNR